MLYANLHVVDELSSCHKHANKNIYASTKSQFLLVPIKKRKQLPKQMPAFYKISF